MMIEQDVEIPTVGRGRLLVVRLVGTVFGFLAFFAGLAGVFWIAGSYRDVLRMGGGSDGLAQTFARLFAPAAISVAGTWILLAMARGLWRGSPKARWAAVCFLVPACLPPLVYFFSAVRGGFPEGAALSFLLLMPPAYATLVLAGWKTDPLFRPKAAAIVAAAPAGAGASVLKLAVVILGFVATIALLLWSNRP